jgi:hypothetical protein
MLDELRNRVLAYLSQNRVCVITTSGSLGAWAVSAQYDNTGLELKCRLPRWSDALFHIEQEPRVMAIIQDANPLRWLQYRGTARIADSSDDRYSIIHIVPQRIDLIDEDRGWGARETLDL